MPDMMETGATWMAGQRRSHASQTVTYRRGGLSVSLAATKAPVRTIQDQEFGGILSESECDWIIRAADIVLGAVVVEPRSNTDSIEESNGKRWQALPTGGEEAYRPADPFNIAWRIHTKRIEAS